MNRASKRAVIENCMNYVKRLAFGNTPITHLQC